MKKGNRFYYFLFVFDTKRNKKIKDIRQLADRCLSGQRTNTPICRIIFTGFDVTDADSASCY